MVDMTDKLISTPCQTGQLCLVPKRRQELLNDENLAPLLKAAAITSVEASCDHETHPDDWFEDPGAGYATAPFWRSQRARARCFQCPVRMACFEEGLKDENIEHGIRGGFTVSQRSAIKAARDILIEKEDRHAEEEQQGSTA